MVHSATPLKEAITHVGKVLAEEERQGFRNRAVIGGIGPFAREGLAPLRGALPTRAADDTLAGIVGLLRDYGTLSPTQRQPRLAAALKELRHL
jgi:hypothetical protein